MTDNAVTLRKDQALVNVGDIFDLMLPLGDRSEVLLLALELAAHLTIERDEIETPEAYQDEDFRRQEVKRRTLKGIEDLRQAANMAELRWAMENGDETWIDANGAEISLREVIEHQMPDEEQRKSSGRARQVWAFAAGKHSAVAAFREQGISDQRIAECNKSGMSSVLGIVSEARKKLADVTPPGELHERYEALIEAAAEATILDALKRTIRTMIDPTDTPPPPIPYSVEANGSHWWMVARPTQEQFLELVLPRLKDVLEKDGLLPEAFARFWREVPVGQGGVR